MKPKKGATSSPLNTAAVDMVSSRLSERERESAQAKVAVADWHWAAKSNATDLGIPASEEGCK